MPVLRKIHRDNYTVLPNELLRDTRLSCCDRGLLVWMLSRPQNWNFSHRALQEALPLDTKGKIQASVTHLSKIGYLKIEQERNGGQLGKTTWFIYDTPYPDMQDTAPYPGIPDSGKAASYKVSNTKKATPALEGGRQPEIYFDPESGAYRRRGTA